MILGIGNDIIDIRRIEKSIERFGDRFIQRVYTEVEQAKSNRRANRAASYGASLGLEIHAGHGLTFDNVQPVAALPEIRELNIGHFLIGEAIFVGLTSSIQKMHRLMDEARV